MCFNAQVPGKSELSAAPCENLPFESNCLHACQSITAAAPSAGRLAVVSSMYLSRSLCRDDRSRGALFRSVTLGVRATNFERGGSGRVARGTRLSPLAPASREDVLQRRTCSSCAVRARRLRAQGAERAHRPNAVQASFTRSFESMSVSRTWVSAEARDYAFAPARSGEHQCRADLSIVVQGERLHGRDPFIVRRVQVRAL